MSCDSNYCVSLLNFVCAFWIFLLFGSFSLLAFLYWLFLWDFPFCCNFFDSFIFFFWSLFGHRNFLNACRFLVQVFRNILFGFYWFFWRLNLLLLGLLTKSFVTDETWRLNLTLHRWRLGVSQQFFYPDATTNISNFKLDILYVEFPNRVALYPLFVYVDTILAT